MKDLKMYWTIIAVSYIATWKASPVVCFCQNVLGIISLFHFFTGKKSLVRYIKLSIIYILVGLPFTIYYFTSGEYTKAKKILNEELKKKLSVSEYEDYKLYC